MVVTRSSAIPLLANVTVALITSRRRGIPTEVGVGVGNGLDEESVVNCDNLLTVGKPGPERYRGRLGPGELHRLDDALRIALGLD